MQRRDFLDPRVFLRPAGQLAGAVDEIRTLIEDAPPDDTVLLRFARRAMATTFEIALPLGTPEAQSTAEECLDLVDQLEAQLTVFRDDSEVSRLNQNAGRAPISVESRLFELLVLCQRLSAETGGAFDVTVGALTKAWGFYRRAGRVPTKEELQAVRGKIGTRHLVLDAEQKTARLTRQGVEINLGSIGKGYALDQLASHLRDRQTASALVHGGFSSIYALGNEPGSTRGWSVGLLDPDDGQKRLAILRLTDRGMGTSAATYQHFEYQGRKLPHLLDPRTTWPAEGMLMATATAPTAALADALATAFFILGVNKTRDYCACHPEIGAVLLPNTPERRLVILGRALQEVI